LCIKTGSKHVRPQLKRALELLAKTYLKNSSILKSEQLMLLRFGLHEDRLRAKLNICELTFEHKIVFNAFEPGFKSHFTSTFHTFVEDCIEQLRKVDPAKMSSLKFNEQLQNTIVEKIQPFLDKCLRSIQVSIKQNFLTQREWNCRDSPDVVNQLLEWHGEADFQWAARDLISQLFISTNSESKVKILPDADYLKKQEATFKKRLVAEVTNRVTSPLYKECCQRLAAVLRNEILETSVNNDSFVNEAPFEGAEFVNRERVVFETSVRKLLHMTRDPTILAHAIQEEVPLRTELVIKLLPSLQRFLECKSLVVAIRHKDEEQIPGTLTIFLDIKDKEFVTVVGGIASIFSDIKMQTDWDLSESAFKHELANYFTNSEELEKIRNDLGDIKQSPEAIAISKITPLERFENELVKYIDVAIQILNGESNNPQSSSGSNATPGSESCVVAGVKLLPTIFEKESLLKKAFQVRSHKVASWN
jgi:hypothetical protein